jgi:hypothetical protein
LPNKLIIIQQGESLPFKFDRGGASIDGWTCQIKVKQKPTDIPTIDRTITADEDRAFSGFLSRTETLNLIEGLWYLTGVLVNEGTDEQEEIPVRFQVTQSWAIPNIVAVITFSPVPGSILNTEAITLLSATAGATIHFTIDGSEPTSSSPIFMSPFLLPAGMQTVKAFGAKIGFENSPITTALYNVLEGTVADVTFSPPAGIILTTTLITLSTITPAATIHFTTDGSPPTILSPVFAAPFLLPVGMSTVRAFAVKINFFDSNETQAMYTVNPVFPIISGLFIRYDLDAPGVIETGSGISLVPDISGAANADLLQSTDVARPPYITAGPNAFADFDGSLDFLETGNFIVGNQAQPNTLIIIFRLKAVLPTQVIYDGVSPVSEHQLSTTAGPLFRAFAGTIEDFTTVPDTLKHNIAIVYDAANSRGYVDGGIDELITTLGTDDLLKLTVGSADGGSLLHTSMEFFQFLMYDRALNNTELNLLGNYFAETQGITYTDIIFPNIAGLFARYDLGAAGVVEAGTGISLIPDLSGLGHDLLQTVDANRPSYDQVGIKFADFNGTTDFMDTGLFPEGAQAQPNTIVIIFRLKDTTGIQTIYDGPSGNRHSLITINTLLAAAAGTQEVLSSVIDTNKHNLAIVFEGGTSRGYFDGGADEGITTLGAQSLTKLLIAINQVGADEGNLELYEMVMYDRALTDSELNEIGNYYAGTQSITYTDI